MFLGYDNPFAFYVLCNLHIHASSSVCILCNLPNPVRIYVYNVQYIRQILCASVLFRLENVMLVHVGGIIETSS